MKVMVPPLEEMREMSDAELLVLRTTLTYDMGAISARFIRQTLRTMTTGYVERNTPSEFASMASAPSKTFSPNAAPNDLRRRLCRSSAGS